MSRRPGRMPLYEAMQTGAARGMRRLDIGAPGPGTDSEASPTGFSGVMRIPAGIMMIAAAVVVLLLIAVYVVGYSRAESELQDDRDDKILAEARSLFDPDASSPAGPDGSVPAFPGGGGELPGGGSADPQGSGGTPAREGGGDDSDTDPGDGFASGPAGRTPAVDPPAGDGAEPTPALFGNRSDWGPILSDPRRPGFYYWIVMETTRTGAVRLSEFLRSRGLEAYGVPGKNGFLRVVVLPGHRSRISPGEANPSSAFAQHEDAIERAGRQWKKLGGTSDLGTKYMSLQN